MTLASVIRYPAMAAGIAAAVVAGAVITAWRHPFIALSIAAVAVLLART